VGAVANPKVEVRKMKNKILAGVALVVVLTIAGIFVWNYARARADYLNEIVHETDRWAVIEDINDDHIAVEPISDEAWNWLVDLYQNKTRMWIGGIVEEYDNKWGFRFKPENITVAEVTAEGLQATIQYISENLDYWLGGWAYVNAKVTEIHY